MASAKTTKKPDTSTREGSLLDEIIASDSVTQHIDIETESPLPNAPRGPVIGQCIDVHHPEDVGLVLVRWQAHNRTNERWLPAIRGIECTVGDNLLVQYPQNSTIPVVTGVVDGFREQQEKPAGATQTITLSQGESIVVTSAEGQKLLEITRDKSGPVVKLLGEEAHLDLRSKLRIEAEGIELNSKQGEIEITSTDDVVVKGNTIRLN